MRADLSPDRAFPEAVGRADDLPPRDAAAGKQDRHGLRAILAEHLPAELRWTTRNRRPPLDRFNALLSYGYGLLHAAVMRGVLSAGLEPALGLATLPPDELTRLAAELQELLTKRTKRNGQ